MEVGGLDNGAIAAADVEAAARIAGITRTRGGPGAGRSDDSSFIDRNVPALHFFTGFHDDYHRPGDDWNRIDAAGTARVATLVLELAARISARQRSASSGRHVESRSTHWSDLSAVFIVVALILINAVYVAAEFAAVGVRRSRIRQLAADGNVLAAWLLP